MKTIVVNLYAGPGAGKTTSAWEIAARLKKENISTEYVPEYAKEVVWENKNSWLLDGSVKSQTMLFEEQHRRIARLDGKVSAIVTDSPLLLNLMYVNGSATELEEMVFEAYGKYNNFNMFIKRGGEYEQAGRLQTLEESIKIDNGIKDLLSTHDIFCGEYDRDNIDVIVSNIQRSLKYNKDFAATKARMSKPKEKKAYRFHGTCR